MLSIIKSCTKAKTVKRLVFTSSAGTVNVQEHQQPVYDENNWSDLDFINEKKMTGWVSIVIFIFSPTLSIPLLRPSSIYFGIIFVTYYLIFLHFSEMKAITGCKACHFMLFILKTSEGISCKIWW